MNGRELDVAMRELAERQHSVVSRAQVRGFGATKDQLRRRFGSPAWVIVTSKVLKLAGSAETFHQRCMAAVLDAGPGAVVSHEAAAALWELPGFGGGLVSVTRRDGRTSRTSRIAVVHDSNWLPESHIVLVTGIPTTTPARTVFDLAGTLHPRKAERTLDNSLARGLTTIPGLRQVTLELSRHGRAGSALMGELLAARDGDYVPPTTGLEARFAQILKEAGLPAPVRQRNLGGKEWVGRVDFLLPFGVVAEVDSSLHHSTKLDREADEARDRELEAAGFRVVRITETEVWHQPGVAVRRVRQTLRAAKATSLALPRRSQH